MADGQVGGGHQNDFKPEGTIYVKHPNPVMFTKRDETQYATRNDNECWTAGTPVRWDDGADPSTAKPIIAPVGGIPDMLVTEDPKTREILEYHPLITFFNEIMARIMRDGHRDWLSNMEKEENAIKLWEYLDEKYLKPEEFETNGSSKTIEAV